MTPAELAIVVNNTEEALKSEALSWPVRAKAALVRTEDDYLAVSDLLKGIKALRTRIAEVLDPHIKRAHEAHKALVKEKADAEAPLTEAEGIIKRTLIVWTTEQERIRQEEQRRLAEEARKAEEARRLEEAAALEAEAMRSGDAELLATAQELVTAPVVAPIVILPPSTPKVAGISYREVWKFQITDASKLPREYLAPDEIKIGGVVRALKGSTNIPGVRVYSEKVAAASGR